MAGSARRNVVLALLATVAVLFNAVGAGACVLLCQTKPCCSAEQAPAAPQRSCCQATQPRNAKPQLAHSAKSGHTCCAWTAKKPELPTFIAKFDDLRFSSVPAVLSDQGHCFVIGDASFDPGVHTTPGRAPPTPPLSSSAPRAPPIV